jgi:hypothetical protein
MPAHGEETRCPASLRSVGAARRARSALPRHSLGMQWTLTASEINPIAWCTAERVPGSDDDDNSCVLFVDHPGRHAYGKALLFL